MAIFKPADILIPQNVDFTKWSVVACDQYTSEREYWEDVKNIVGDSPSTLNIIFPEVYLEDGDGDERIKKINSTMEEYINKGIFRKLNDTFIYVKRTQPNGKTRHGIVGMLDLEEYDFSKGSQSKVRATEGTIIERIPPRQRIRKNAPLEAPHILILIDDREKAVVEPLENQINDFEKIYDFENLHKAWEEARKGKRYRDDVLIFNRNYEEQLINIQNHLIYETYEVGKYHTFYVYEPKKRLIMSLPFKDRIVQWAIYRQLFPLYEKTFIFDSYACRKGKGTHKAADRLQYWLR